MSQSKICPQCGTEYELDQRFCPRDGSTLRAQNTGGDLVGEIVADRYHVLRKLGEGGMGQVYLAEHVKMGRKSAVKVMNPGMVHDADAISRFNREAANASRINHPHVAAIYDFGETPDGLIYLAMEFVEGEPLTKLVERLGALPAPRAAAIAQQAADALATAHDMGIVHRDLKPDNIMIARNRDGSDCVKVVDFGIAKAGDNAAQKVTKTGLVVGTPEYMSPEQLAGDRLDGRSDIYSLALVTFNMLTGRLPFPAETVQEAMIMRLTDRPRTLAETRPDVAWPAELQAVLDRGLARDANERYRSASEFGRDIARAVATMPMTLSAEMGTEVLAVVPPTRVGAPAGLAASASARTALDTPAPARAGAPPAAAPPGASRPSRSRRPLVFAALALGAVIAVGGGLFAVTRDDVAAIADSTAQNVTTGTAQPSDTVTSSIPAVPMTGGDSSRLLASAGAAPSRKAAAPVTELRRETPAATVPAGLTNAEIARRLTELERWSDPNTADASDARRVVDRSADLLPQLRTRAQRVEALYYLGQAYFLLEENENACRVLREARGEASGTPFERAIDANFSLDDAPCR